MIESFRYLLIHHIAALKAPLRRNTRPERSHEVNITEHLNCQRGPYFPMGFPGFGQLAI
jgi:hypothetical protein